jgi:hypothetical protein
MTPADSPTVFVMNDHALCVRPCRAASMDAMIGPILYRLPVRRVRVRSQHINGIIDPEVNHS